MAEVGLQEVETYISRRQNTMSQYIVTRPIMDLCMAAERSPRPILAMQKVGTGGSVFGGDADDGP